MRPVNWVRVEICVLLKFFSCDLYKHLYIKVLAGTMIQQAETIRSEQREIVLIK